MPERPASAPPLRWTAHPAARDPLRAALVALGILLAAAFTWSLTGSAPLTGFAALALAVSVRAFFLPRTYVLDATGASEQGPLQAPRRLGWDEVRRVTRERHGVHLSPLHRPRRWLPDRGIFLRTDGDAEQLARWVAERRRGA